MKIAIGCVIAALVPAMAHAQQSEDEVRAGFKARIAIWNNHEACIRAKLRKVLPNNVDGAALLANYANEQCSEPLMPIIQDAVSAGKSESELSAISSRTQAQAIKAATAITLEMRAATK